MTHWEVNVQAFIEGHASQSCTAAALNLLRLFLLALYFPLTTSLCFFAPISLPLSAPVIISVTQTEAHFHISPQQREIGPDNYTPLCLYN